MNRLKYMWYVMKEEKGIGVVEVILILVVLIGLVIIFKSQLTSLVNTILKKSPVKVQVFNAQGNVQWGNYGCIESGLSITVFVSGIRTRGGIYSSVKEL